LKSCQIFTNASVFPKRFREKIPEGVFLFSETAQKQSSPNLTRLNTFQFFRQIEMSRFCDKAQNIQQPFIMNSEKISAAIKVA
jgi:hypothetical protein